MKTRSKLIVAILAVTVMVSLPLWYMDRESYTWPNQVMETVEGEGWRLVGVTTVRHMMRPWTWLRPCPTGEAQGVRLLQLDYLAFY